MEPRLYLDLNKMYSVNQCALCAHLCVFPRLLLTTSPAGAVAKYYDEHVCVCLSVCLSVREHIFGATRAIFTNVFVHVVYGRGSVLR